MIKRKLNYTFHNPNTAEATADYVLKILIDANRGKVERALQNDEENASKSQENEVTY